MISDILDDEEEGWETGPIESKERNSVTTPMTKYKRHSDLFNGKKS